jgi:hypothetical protein
VTSFIGRDEHHTLAVHRDVVVQHLKIRQYSLALAGLEVLRPQLALQKVLGAAAAHQVKHLLAVG